MRNKRVGFSNRSLSRRALLRGAGAALALPWLDAMRPAIAKPATRDTPKRFAWVYIPNGVVQDAWHPEKIGVDWEMTYSITRCNVICKVQPNKPKLSLKLS